MADRACGAVISDGNVLLVHQTYKGVTFWTLPGGSIEPGEDAGAAAHREIREETGLHVCIVRQLYRAPRESSTGTYHCFLADIVGGALGLGTDTDAATGRAELHDVRWFPLDSVRGLPEIAGLLQHLSESDLTARGVCHRE